MSKYTHNRAVDKAIETALLSTFRVRIGCILLDKNKKLVSTGYNSSDHHPKQASASHATGASPLVTVHGEIDALIKARRVAYSAYVVRILKDGTLSMSASCKICYHALNRAGISRIYYSDWNGNIQEMRIK